MSNVVERYSALFALIGIAIWVTTIATHRIMHKLEREQPDLLRSVGVKSIDWWFSCWRGIFLLAFTQQGTRLSTAQRWAMRGCIISSASLIAAGLAITALN